MLAGAMETIYITSDTDSDSGPSSPCGADRFAFVTSPEHSAGSSPAASLTFASFATAAASPAVATEAGDSNTAAAAPSLHKRKKKAQPSSPTDTSTAPLPKRAKNPTGALDVLDRAPTSPLQSQKITSDQTATSAASQGGLSMSCLTMPIRTPDLERSADCPRASLSGGSTTTAAAPSIDCMPRSPSTTRVAAREMSTTELQALRQDIADCVARLADVVKDGTHRKHVIKSSTRLQQLLKRTSVSPLSLAFVGAKGVGKSNAINRLLFPEGDGRMPLPQGSGAYGVTQAITLIRPRPSRQFTVSVVLGTLTRDRLGSYRRRHGGQPPIRGDCITTNTAMHAQAAEQLASHTAAFFKVAVCADQSYASAEEMAKAMEALGQQLTALHKAAYAPIIDHIVVEGPFRHATADIQLCDMSVSVKSEMGTESKHREQRHTRDRE